MAEMLYRKRGKRYVPDPELSALAPFDAVEMLICTTRYYTGRSTGSSPRARGTVLRVLVFGAHVRFIPACAGNRS